MLPRAILFDLDDTLIQAYAEAQAAWLVVAHELADDLEPFTPGEIAEAVGAFARTFWADPERHRLWRMRLSHARREIVAGCFLLWRAQGARPPRPGLPSGLPTDFRPIAMRICARFPTLIPSLTRSGHAAPASHL
jgi:phosphoglycolate phosphatase-like HAD superfamily hydrolase